MPRIPDDGLTLADFRKLSSPPCNPAIRISQSMAWYRDALYVGTGRGLLRGPLRTDKAWRRQRSADVSLDAFGAEVWRFEPPSKRWRQVYSSPLVASAISERHARDRSIRAQVVWQGTDDEAPALYLAAGSLEGQVILLRSSDGEVFSDCGPPGLGQGDADIASLRTLCPWRGWLHTSPTGKNRGRGMVDDNEAAIPVVFASRNPARGDWRAASSPGFGDPDNLAVNELVVFQDCLYAATVNRRRGFQVWKVVDSHRLPYRWEKIIDQGAWRGPASPIPACLHGFGDYLYLGTAFDRQGPGGADRFAPFAPELLRIAADDSWELLAGEPRCTPHGLKRPLSGQRPGFNNPFTQAFWRLAAYQGWLYLGATDWRFRPNYLPRPGRPRPDLSEARLNFLRTHTESYAGEFGLWRSRDGRNWTAVTTAGFGDGLPYYGIRELTATPHGLFLALASFRSGTLGGGLLLWWGGPPVTCDSVANP